MEALGGLAADDGARAGLQPRLLLFRRDQELGVHVQELLRYDGHLGEEVLGVLVNAAKPGFMRGHGYARNTLHAGLVRFRQRLNNGDLVPHHEAVLAGHGHAAGEGLPDGREEAEQNERDHNREQRQDGAEFLPLQIAPDQVQVLHRSYWKARAACWRLSNFAIPDLPKSSISPNWAWLKVDSSPVP